MQLYALDHDNKLISATHAAKQRDYYCLECSALVRLRGGAHRKNHFYHLYPTRACFLNAKSMTHLQIQAFLQRVLPEGECFLEKPFPNIKRIADACWMPKKLIFEIQCSAITAEEVEQRNRDYQSAGFQVVWILHDQRYNRTRMTGAERFLQSQPHYFTNFNAEGQGIIYDQLSYSQKNRRSILSTPFAVDLAAPKTLLGTPKAKIPHMIKQRIDQWRCHFAGDLVDLFHQNDLHIQASFEKALALEKEEAPTWRKRSKNLFWFCIIRPYKLFFQMLLESACK